MAEELRYKSDKEPTFLNAEAIIGLMSPLSIVGGIIGGWLGQERMERERTEGKIVSSEPSSWNREALIGGMIGADIGVIGGYILGIMAAAATELVAAATFANPVGWAVGIAVALGATAVGSYMGADVGEKRQVREYEEAKKQYIVSQLSQNVSPEVGQAVEYTMAHNKDWGKKMLEEKLITAGQPRTVS